MKPDRIFTPQLLLFLFTIPFMLICPLTLTSLFFGFPSSILINNNNLDEYRSSFELLNLPSESSSILGPEVLIGGFDITPEDEKHSCDYVAYDIISSNLTLEEVSSFYLEQFQENYGTSINFPYNYELVNGSLIKVFPFNINDAYFSNDGFSFSIEDNFNQEDPAYYLVYLINYNVNESQDSRCQADELPESSILIDQETNKEEEEVTEEIENIEQSSQ